MSYYKSIKIEENFEDAILLIKESLQCEGFGVLTEIDIQKKLKEKLDVDYKKYLILGACNPSFAYKALQLEDKIGTMLPCNVILQEVNENQTEISVVDPIASMQAVGNNDLLAIATEVKSKLIKALMAIIEA